MLWRWRRLIFLYYLFKFISDRSAGKLAVGILIIVVALFLSDVFNMHTLNFLLENVVQVGIIGGCRRRDRQ